MYSIAISIGNSENQKILDPIVNTSSSSKQCPTFLETGMTRGSGIERGGKVNEKRANKV